MLCKHCRTHGVRDDNRHQVCQKTKACRAERARLWRLEQAEIRELVRKLKGIANV